MRLHCSIREIEIYLRSVLEDQGPTEIALGLGLSVEAVEQSMNRSTQLMKKSIGFSGKLPKYIISKISLEDMPRELAVVYVASLESSLKKEVLTLLSSEETEVLEALIGGELAVNIAKRIGTSKKTISIRRSLALSKIANYLFEKDVEIPDYLSKYRDFKIYVTSAKKIDSAILRLAATVEGRTQIYKLLNEREREFFNLTYVDGLGEGEVAKAMNVEVIVVERLRRTIRKKFKNSFQTQDKAA